MSAAEQRPRIEYLLNAVERASSQPEPARHGYAEKRRALIEYVVRLDTELANARQRALEAGMPREFTPAQQQALQRLLTWAIDLPGRSTEDVVHEWSAELGISRADAIHLVGAWTMLLSKLERSATS